MTFHVTQNLPGCVAPELTQSYDTSSDAVDDFMHRVVEAYEALEDWDMATEFGSPSHRQEVVRELVHPFWGVSSVMVDGVIYAVEWDPTNPDHEALEES